MNKIYATLLTLVLFVMSIMGCKKSREESAACETTLKFRYSGNGIAYSEQVGMRFNANHELVSFSHGEENFTYQYKKNEVIVLSGGNKVYSIGLVEGRAVSIGLNGQPDYHRISYDEDGRMSKIVIQQNGVVGNIYTFSYKDGNLHSVIEEISGETNVERKFTFEYTDLKSDVGTQAFEPFFGLVLSNSIPEAIRGKGSVNLPSKRIYSEKRGELENRYTTGFSYTRSPDGMVTGINVKYVSEVYTAGVLTREIDRTESQITVDTTCK